MAFTSVPLGYTLPRKLVEQNQLEALELFEELTELTVEEIIAKLQTTNNVSQPFTKI